MSEDYAPPSAAQDHGCLPPWRTCDLPEPLPFSFWNALRTIGPGAILLAGAIGGGEWIVGPLMVVQYGPSILWIATMGILLQTIFNLEGIRYTLYTGEPILTGVMRLNPGPKFWAPFYILIGTAQLATPAIAAGCAIVLFGAFVGRMPESTDQDTLEWIGTGVILVSAALLLSGRSIERLLEKLSWGMILFIFVFLIAVNVLCVPASTSWSTTRGFLLVQPLPKGVSLVLVGLFAATAGSGGLGNLAVTNWFRDKGFGMGANVGGIGGALAHGEMELQTVGATCPLTPENRRRWKTWWRYARLDQQALWGVGCFLGMFLNVNLAAAIIPPNMKFEGYSSGAFQAHYLAEQFGQWLWLLTLLNGFWILFSTHLGNTDVLVRTIADILWASSPTMQTWKASRIYAGLLVILTAWALIAIHFGNVLDLFKVLGIVATPIMAIAAVQILRVNRRFLPPEFRPPLWREMVLLGSVVVYGGIAVALVWNLLPK
ncbi:MAG: Nramp family divalent metal transporter [Planctomycetaceae bacterium]|nr:Nramp family divalent metal transporter [Planctomycetaceae bacterium]